MRETEANQARGKDSSHNEEKRTIHSNTEGRKAMQNIYEKQVCQQRGKATPETGNHNSEQQR